jgi:hypothetical protein
MEEIAAREDDQYRQYLYDHGLGHIQNMHGLRAIVYYHPQRSQVAEQYHPNRWVANKTLEWIDSNKHKPFFCRLAGSTPIHHLPYPMPIKGSMNILIFRNRSPYLKKVIRIMSITT